MSAVVYHELWRSDSAPVFPGAGHNGVKSTFFPSDGGYRFIIFTFPPGDGRFDLADADIEAGLREFEDKLPGVLALNEVDNPGMHTTDTVDFDVVLSGEVFMELDAGAEVLLKPGDCVVQNGTRHAWHNRSAAPCVIAVALVGASRAS